ncbi:MAG: GNAT family N-acetyltransferase [Beijerinckiaceae bacterium]
MFGFFDRTSTPSIRRIGPEWSRDCARIHAQCFARGWQSTEFASLLTDRQVLADGAIDARMRQMSGFVLSRKAADEAEILTIAVAPPSRRKGIGSNLLSTHLGRLAAAGANTLFLEVDAENQAALALYAGFAFRRVGERKTYYPRPGGADATAFIMRRDLR